MTVSRNAALAAAALACLSTVAVAQPDPSSDRLQARVVYADLNLGSAAGRATFSARLRAAVRATCGDPSDRDLQPAVNRCSREMTQDGMGQLTALALREQAVRVAAR